jgi:O-acetylserine/cysteine efflux transporter
MPEAAPSRRSGPAWGYALAGLDAVLAGFGIVVGKAGAEALPPLLFGFWLTLFAAAFTSAFWVAGRRERRPRLVSRRRLVLLAVLHAAISFGAIALFYGGLAGLQPAVASFLGRAETLVAILLGVLLFRERFRAMEGVGLFLALGGIAVMRLPSAIAAEAGEGRAYALLLGGATLFGVSEVVTKVAAKGVPASTFVLVRNGALAVLFLAAALATGDLALPPAPPLLSAAGAALLGPTLARLLYMEALRWIDLSKAAIVNQAQPIAAALLAFLAFRTLPRPLEWLGGGLILLGSALLILGRRPRQETRP